MEDVRGQPFVGIVARVATAVARERTLANLVDVVLDQAIRTLGARFAYAHRADERQRILELLGHRNIPREFLPWLARAPYDAPLAASKAACSREPLILPSLAALDPGMTATAELMHRQRCESLAALPLIEGDRLVGVLTFGLPEASDFTHDERDALASCAEIFACGIANGGRQEEEQELARLHEEWDSIVAHDLRQPLSIITSYLGFMPKLLIPLQPEKLRQALDQLQRAAKRLDRMIGDLAEASQMLTGRLVLERHACELRELMREVVERQRILHPDRIFELRLPAGPPPTLLADPMRLEQVLVNLLDNALEHGGPETPVGVELRSGGSEVCIRVTNRGPPIPAADLPKLFRRYFRARNAAGGHTRGLGLGLYIARSIVEAHGGRIWAESRPGETAFELALPRGS